MARRKQAGEVNIGSDSFLDVIANIVGILIILIVIAGVRVSTAPKNKNVLPKVPLLAIQAKPEPVKVPKVPIPEVVAEEPEETLEAAYVEQTEMPADIAEKIRTTQDEIARLQSSIAASEGDKQDLEQRQAAGELQVSDGRNKLQVEKKRFESRKRGIEEIQSLLAGQKKNLELLKTQLAELQKQAPHAKILKHRVTPLSKTVTGDQLHFRLNDNRVSQVPINDLLEAAMRQAKRHIDELASNRTHIGTVGPLRGYYLKYKLGASAPSAAESAQYGRGMVRIALRSFQLVPDDELKDESADEALTRGSDFDLAVQTAEPGSTFTLWVYPDSFTLYRQLKDRLHEAGFTVAGRPLPLGIPIAASPDGSASAGQ